MVEGDQRMRDESVEVERRVGVRVVLVGGRQASEVTPASWPMSRASKVIENCRVLGCSQCQKYSSRETVRSTCSLPSSLLAHGA